MVTWGTGKLSVTNSTREFLDGYSLHTDRSSTPMTAMAASYFTLAVAEPPRLLFTVTLFGLTPEKLNEPS
jgi:hypothetical protein